MIYIYAIIYVCIVSISKERGRIGRAALNNRKRAQLIPAVRMMKQARPLPQHKQEARPHMPMTNALAGGRGGGEGGVQLHTTYCLVLTWPVYKIQIQISLYIRRK